jgi:hypothetical protein
MAPAGCGSARASHHVEHGSVAGLEVRAVARLQAPRERPAEDHVRLRAHSRRRCVPVTLRPTAPGVSSMRIETAGVAWVHSRIWLKAAASRVVHAGRQGAHCHFDELVPARPASRLSASGKSRSTPRSSSRATPSMTRSARIDDATWWMK